MNVFVAGQSGTADHQVTAHMTSIRMPLSNAKATAELGWRPRYSTIRDGLAQMFQHAA